MPKSSKRANKFTVVPHFPPIDEPGVEAFESRTGIELPRDYRSFLLEHNGGVPDPQQADVPDTKHSVLVDFLYGILPRRARCDLEYEAARAKGDLPPGFLVIGHDPGGNAFLLATAGDDRGRVYFWDKRGLLARGRNGNTFRLADRFKVLMRSLYPAEGT